MAEEESIVALRRERNLGPKGIQSELLRLEGRTFSTATIWKVLARRDLNRVRRPRAVRQPALRRHRIKFRPILPRSPHLNGKVERSQQTDRIEFWATIDLDSPDLELHPDEWQHFYNWIRPHSSLGGLTPIARLGDLLWHTPSKEDVSDAYVPKQEPFKDRDDSRDLQTLRLKRSL